MQKSTFKKIIYGTFFGIIILSIAGLIYLKFSNTATCFDNKQNQGEEGIDCGGPCNQICLPSDFRNIEILETKFINVNNKLILLAKIQNPNSEIAVKNFDYTFNILDENKQILKTVTGQSFIYSEEIKYIEEFIDSSELENKTKFLNFEIKNSVIVKSNEFKKPNVKLLDQSTEVQNNTLKLSGRIINNDFITFKNVKILANFYNEYGLWVGSSQTIIDNIAPQEIKDFKINFINENLNELYSEIIIEIKRQ